MKLIKSNEQLEIGREYWVRYRPFKPDGTRDAFSQSTKVSIQLCDTAAHESADEKIRQERKYLGSQMRMWASDSNNQALKNFEVIGPIPKREAPDFDTYIERDVFIATGKLPEKRKYENE